MTISHPVAFSSWVYGDGGPESAAIDRVLRSGRLTMGPETEAFEAALAEYHGRGHAIACNSGSSANLLAVHALGFGSYKSRIGLVPAIAWATTYAPLMQTGKGLTVVDVDDTWNAPVPELANPEAYGFAVAVPVLGNPAHLAAWAGFAADRGIPLLVDGCESMGAFASAPVKAGPIVVRNATLPVGAFGTIATGSGFYSHQISAVELGWCLTDDDELARIMRLLRNHGNAGWGEPDPADRYRFEIYGFNLRPVELHCAIAAAQLARLDGLVRARQDNYAWFKDATDALPITFPHIEGNDDTAPFGLAFELDDPSRRTPLLAALKAHGIDARPPTGGSYRRHPYAAPWAATVKTPRADRIHDAALFLGNAPYPIPALIDRAVAVMREAL